MCYSGAIRFDGKSGDVNVIPAAEVVGKSVAHSAGRRQRPRDAESVQLSAAAARLSLSHTAAATTYRERSSVRHCDWTVNSV